jgi:hypothetical protein
MALRSGSICLKSGIRENKEHRVVVSVSKGDIMPHYNVQEVIWNITHYTKEDFSKKG